MKFRYTYFLLFLVVFSEIESISIKRRSSKFMTERKNKRLRAQMALAIMEELRGDDEKEPKYVFSKILQRLLFKGKDTGLGRFIGGLLTGLTPSNLAEILEMFFDFVSITAEEIVNDKKNDTCVFSRIYYALSDETDKVTSIGIKLYKIKDEGDEKKDDNLCEKKDEITKVYDSYGKGTSKAKKKLEKLVKQLNDQCPGTFRLFFSKIKEFFKSVFEKIKKFAKKIVNFFLPLYSKIKTGILAAMKYLKCLVENSFVGEVFKKFTPAAVSDIILKGLEKISIIKILKNLFKKLSEVYETGKLIYEVIAASLNGKWMEFKEKLAYLLGTVVKFFLNSLTKYEDIVNSFTEVIMNFFEDSMIKNLIDSAKDVKEEREEELEKKEKEEYKKAYEQIEKDHKSVTEDSIEGSPDENYEFEYDKNTEINNEYLETKIRYTGNNKGEYSTSFVSPDPTKDAIVPENPAS
jgi:hypothetical protein